MLRGFAHQDGFMLNNITSEILQKRFRGLSAQKGHIKPLIARNLVALLAVQEIVIVRGIATGANVLLTKIGSI